MLEQIYKAYIINYLVTLNFDEITYNDNALQTLLSMILT